MEERTRVSMPAELQGSENGGFERRECQVNAVLQGVATLTADTALIPERLEAFAKQSTF